jgi:hypothetical protein
MTDSEAGAVSSPDVAPKRAASVVWCAAAGLAVYSVLLVYWAGDFGFDGDDWWVLSWPYWRPFPESFLSYAKEFLRPVEGLYWVTLFELFGFNRLAFHLSSLFLLTGSCALMGVCLSKAFPGRRGLAGLAVLLAFFLPTVSCLTYMVFTDNSRLSLLLYWASVLAFQVWAERERSWAGLILPVILYLMSFLTYEAPSFLIFVVPFLVWPIYARRPDEMSLTAFGFRTGVAVVGGFAAAVAIRMFCLGGGAVGQSHLLPPVELVGSYLALLPCYLVAPFSALSSESVARVLGLAVGLGTVAILWVFFKDKEKLPRARVGDSHQPRGTLDKKDFFERSSYPMLLGAAILCLGMLPYQMAGYGGTAPTLSTTVLAKWGFTPDAHPTWFNFNEASRIYSSATCGLAIALAALATAWQRPRAIVIGRTLAAIAVGFMAVFHAGLSVDWAEAAKIRTAILTDLVRTVPAVEPKTNFVFFDLECYHKRAAVIRGWSGLRELVRMLYGDQTLGAWYVYPSATEWPNSGHQQAFVCRSGFVSRGMNMLQPVRHESILLLTRSKEHLSLIPRTDFRAHLCSRGICWRGAYTLHCNAKRIIQRLRPTALVQWLFSRKERLVTTPLLEHRTYTHP